MAHIGTDMTMSIPTPTPASALAGSQPTTAWTTRQARIRNCLFVMGAALIEPEAPSIGDID